MLDHDAIRSEIRRRRNKIGLTMDEAARRAGFIGANPASRWNDIESGRREGMKLDTLAGVAEALECKVVDLIKETPRA